VWLDDVTVGQCVHISALHANSKFQFVRAAVSKVHHSKTVTTLSVYWSRFGALPSIGSAIFAEHMVKRSNNVASNTFRERLDERHLEIHVCGTFYYNISNEQLRLFRRLLKTYLFALY